MFYLEWPWRGCRSNEGVPSDSLQNGIGAVALRRIPFVFSLERQRGGCHSKGVPLDSLHNGMWGGRTQKESLCILFRTAEGRLS